MLTIAVKSSGGGEPLAVVVGEGVVALLAAFEQVVRNRSRSMRAWIAFTRSDHGHWIALRIS
jgi:hypothetical protein